MKLVFGIMSAVHSAATVDQLAGALAPWPVVIHHDFSQTPEFAVTSSNVTFVPAPKQTGWGVWGFSEGIEHLLSHCLHVEQADYFQLLSPTCLPIRPMSDFKQHIEQSGGQVHISFANLTSDIDLMMNFGYRAYFPAQSLRFRALRKLSHFYFGDVAQTMIANMQTRRRDDSSTATGAAICRAAMIAASRGWFGAHVFQADLRAAIGGTWFGCRREAGLYFLERMRNARLREHFSKMWIPDEMLFASVFANSDFAVEQSNHFVSEFTNGNPNWLELTSLEKAMSSEKYFARKFHDDPEDPARLCVLSRLAEAATSTKVSDSAQPNQPVQARALVGESN